MANNESDLDFLPSGLRNPDGTFTNVGEVATYWFKGEVYFLQNNSKEAYKMHDHAGNLSGAIRCIMDK